MTPTRDSSVAARVPGDLRADLEELARRDDVELSLVVRKALRRYADEELGRAPRRPSLLDGGTGARRRNGSSTEIAAALKVAPRVGTARFAALAEYELAGARGLTPDEVCKLLEPAPVNSTARRVTDLVQGGAVAAYHVRGGSRGAEAYAAGHVRPLERGEDHLDGELVRKTRAGAWAHVYVITPLGHRLLEDARAKARAKEQATLDKLVAAAADDVPIG